MPNYFKLIGHTPVPCSAEEAEQLLDDVERWRIGFTSLPDCDVSTIFLVSDHSRTANRSPVFFETLISGGPHCNYRERYRSWNEASEGHARAVRIACGELEHGHRPSA